MIRPRLSQIAFILFVGLGMYLGAIFIMGWIP